MKLIVFAYLSFMVFFSFGLSAQSNPCQNHDIFKKLDFWVGEWNVLNPQGQPSGQNKITKILDGCVILEEWTGSGPSRGKSLNFYNPKTKHWQQVWVDNFGNPLEFKGVVGRDSMTYTGISLNQSGNEVLNEMILSKINKDKVHQLWRQSQDNGTTWTVAFDGQYIRKD